MRAERLRRCNDALCGARAVIDLDALAHNLQRIRELAPDSRIMAVIKADGYGHGALRVAHALMGADAFGVARVAEGMALRSAGIRHKIVVLEGFSSPEELILVREHGLDTVLHHPSQLEMLEQAPAGATILLWLKIDTGMHRLGFPPVAYGEIMARLSGCAAVAMPVGLMTHLASADELKNPQTSKQLACFQAVAEQHSGQLSIANSAGILAWEQAHADWLRPGIMLYGISPFSESTGGEHGLRPVMNFSTRLIAVNQLSRGDAVGYGGRWVCPEDMAVGVAAVGYGDGYPRHATAGTPVLVNGERVPLIGRVSMDMISVDLRSQPTARVGDPVLLWGAELPVEVVALAANTIPYELTCKLTNRVERVEEGVVGLTRQDARVS